MGNEQSIEKKPEGQITINIRAADRSQGFNVDLGGQTKQLATAADLAAFGFPITKLKNVIKSLENYTPHYIFLYSPARIRGFIYSKAMGQCNKTLKPKKYSVLRKETETVAVSSRTLKNNSANTGVYKSDMSYTETNTVATKWLCNGTVAGGLTVDHKIITPGSAELTLTACYGKEEEKSSTVTIGSESGVSVELAPGQEAVATIKLLKHVFEVEIEYEGTLSGTVTAAWDYFNLKVLYYDVSYLMKLAGIENTATFKEIIKMEYFSDGEVELSDW